MKVEIHEELVDAILGGHRDAPFPDDAIHQVVGLNAKTLENLNEGGFHKLETVHQLELVIGFEKSKASNFCGSDEIYFSPWKLGSVTAIRGFGGWRVIAIALPSRGLFKLIHDSAKQRSKLCWSEAHGDDAIKRRARDLAFDNYLYSQTEMAERRAERRSRTNAGALEAGLNADIVSVEGFNTVYQFTIDEEATPLTQIQKKHVTDLDACIHELVDYARSAKTPISNSFEAQLEVVDAGTEIRKRFMDVVARLKRVKLNVLVYDGVIRNRVFDMTELEDPPPESEQKLYGPDSEYYVFTYSVKKLHIILAPDPYLRLQLPYEDEDFRKSWHYESEWGYKVSRDGEVHKDRVDDVIGSAAVKGSIEPDAQNVVRIVPAPDAQSDEKN